MIVADTIAAILAGSHDPFCDVLSSTSLKGNGQGSSTVIGRGRVAGPELAAYLNTVPATVLQIDEGHRLSRGHPAIHVVPAALAAGEEVDASGKELLRAVVAGYEVAARIGLLVGALPSDMHPHGSWGAFGSAVAAAQLLGGTESHLADVIDAVASIPIFPWNGTVAKGDSIHHLYAATGVQIGMQCARAVLSGASVDRGTFENFYAARFAQGDTDWASAGHEIERNYFKYYAMCAHLHTSIQALEELRRAHNFTGQEVESISVRTFPQAARLNATHPGSPLAARFSVSYCLARTLVYGEMGMSLLSEEDVRDPQIAEVAARISTIDEPAYANMYPEVRPARLEVHLRDGQRLCAVEVRARGEYLRPESDAHWREKMIELVGERTAARLCAFVEHHPAEWNVRELMEAINV